MKHVNLLKFPSVGDWSEKLMQPTKHPMGSLKELAQRRLKEIRELEEKSNQ